MSYSTVLGVVPDQRPTHLLELSNGHGWSPSIWSRLIKELYGFDGSWMYGEGERYLDQLWKEIEDLPEWVQAPLVLTFDTGVIPGQAYLWAADMLDEFERRLPESSTRVNHVPAVAALLRSLPETPFLGMWGTSVSGNPFDPWDGDADTPGSGIPLSHMYVLGRHHDILGGTSVIYAE